jgi:hypothetical protein
MLHALGPYVLTVVAGILAVETIALLIGGMAIGVANAFLFAPIAFAIFRTITLANPDANAIPRDGVCDDARDRIMEQKDKLASHLAQALRCKTISHDVEGLPAGTAAKLQAEKAAGLKQLREYFKQTYPVLHESYPPVHINEHTLVFELKGSSPELKPYLL